MMRVKVSAFLLIVAVIALGLGEITSAQGERRDPWRLLTTPQFSSLQGKVQVTAFLPEGSRTWTMDLWADENSSRVQFTLPHPDGPRQIITITLPNAVWVLLPFAKRSIRYEGSGLPSWRDMWQIRTDKIDMAKNNYNLKVVGRDRIAGYFCLVLQLEPKYKGNASRKIWVHPPTRLPLQVERYSPDGQLEIRVTLSEAKINEPLPALIFDPSTPNDWKVEAFSLKRQRIEIGQTNETLGFVPLFPTWLPPGYLLEGIFALGEQRWRMAHIVYTDGIGVISVFQHPAPPKHRSPDAPSFPPPLRPFGRPHRGAPPPKGAPPMHLLFPQRILVRDIDNLKVVLVSDVTQDWLEKMADSMKPSTAAR
ncbi:MAG: hypothetical protein NZ805_03500 [Armatimonadetes bacterium]|nr:hypothetical protein [Armatimonadota bacterium]MDW8028086.1 sigma-E factor regulatory protein RseB domain-containing protein [Armatimonadota bacterium]